VVAAGRILGEGWHGTVGQRRLGHEGGAVDRFEGKPGQETHRPGPPMAAHLGQRHMSVLGQGSGRRRRLPGRRAPERCGGARG
jgi:hypothetical protein